MSMEMAKKFLEFLQKDPEAAGVLKAQEKPESGEELFAAYADLAKERGFETTPDEMKALFEELSRETAEKTETARAAMQELSMEDLDLVAGGGDHSECESSYKHRENCWGVDACDKLVVKYKGYWCAQASRIYCEQISDVAP